MAKTVVALKDILRREERLLKKLQETIPLVAHKETHAVLSEIAKIKKTAIAVYRKIIKTSEKCPAVNRKTMKP